jgi:Gp5-like OB domain-containing protein
VTAGRAGRRVDPVRPLGQGDIMNKTMLALLIFALVQGGAGSREAVAQTQKACPPEVAQAQAALKDAQAASKKAATKPQDIQAPRSQAGARTQDVNAPRTQNVNAPRTQDVNAPRTQDVNAPRTQDVNAPRTQDVNAPRTQDVNAPRTQDVNAPRTQDVNAPRTPPIDAPRLKKAESLVSQAQAACKKGDMTGAAARAKQALAVLNK